MVRQMKRKGMHKTIEKNKIVKYAEQNSMHISKKIWCWQKY